MERKVKRRVRVCPNCGVLLDPGDSRCYQCQALVSPITAPGIRLWLKRQLTASGNITLELILTNFLIFFLLWFFSIRKNGLSFDLDFQLLQQFGAKSSFAVVFHQPWRLITAIFLHANFLHIFFNMWVLRDLGQSVEELYGKRLFFFFFIASGMAGYAVSAFWYPDVPSLGASGAIMGLAGVLLADSLQKWNRGGKVMAQGLLRWLFLIFLFGFFLSGYVDNAAHIGGFLTGFLLAFLFSARILRKEFFETVLAAATFFVVIASFLAMLFSP